MATPYNKFFGWATQLLLPVPKGAEIFYHEETLRPLTKVYNHNMRVLTGCMRSTPIPILHAISRCPPLGLVWSLVFGRLCGRGRCDCRTANSPLKEICRPDVATAPVKGSGAIVVVEEDILEPVFDEVGDGLTLPSEDIVLINTIRSRIIAVLSDLNDPNIALFGARNNDQESLFRCNAVRVRE